MHINHTKRWRWVVALCGTLLATTGCASSVIATIGVASVQEIYAPETRAEVRAAFGEADETRTRPDGLMVEQRTIRQQVRVVCQEHDTYRCLALDVGNLFTMGIVDVLATAPTTLARSERAKLHYTFVYDAEDRVLCRYDDAAVPPARFAVAIGPLAEALSRRLKADGCPSWATCLTLYAEEVRRRAACLERPLFPEQEATLRDLIALAAYADAGRFFKDVALARIDRCAPLKPEMSSCVPPAPAE